MSTIVSSGCEAEHDRLADADELVRVSVVGQERDGPGRRHVDDGSGAPPPPPGRAGYCSPSSRDRRVAALTASSTAARIAPASSARNPAAVVPPGEVTAARSCSAVSPESVSITPAPRIVPCTERGRDVARQTVEHAGLDHRLGEQEHVGGPRAGEPGHRVERRLGHLDHRADRAEQPRGAVSTCASVACVPARDRGHALTDQRRCVRHRPDDRPPRDRGLDRSAIGDARRDREHEGVGVERGRRRVEHGGDVGGLHRDDHDVRVRRPPTGRSARSAPRAGATRSRGAGPRRSRRRRASRRRARRRAGRRRAPRPCGRPRAPRCDPSRRRLLARGARRAAHSGTREGPRNPWPAPHFPERSGRCTPGLSCRSPVGGRSRAR